MISAINSLQLNSQKIQSAHSPNFKATIQKNELPQTQNNQNPSFKGKKHLIAAGTFGAGAILDLIGNAVTPHLTGIFNTIASGTTKVGLAAMGLVGLTGVITTLRKLGGEKTLMASFIPMGAGAAITGLLPAFHDIGIATAAAGGLAFVLGFFGTVWDHWKM